MLVKPRILRLLYVTELHGFRLVGDLIPNAKPSPSQVAVPQQTAKLGLSQALLGRCSSPGPSLLARSCLILMQARQYAHPDTGEGIVGRNRIVHE